MASVLSAFGKAKEVKKVQAQTFDTTTNTCTYCHFDAQAECELGLERPDSKLCAKCVASCYDDIVRTKC